MITATTDFDSGGGVDVTVHNWADRVELELIDDYYVHEGYFHVRLDGVAGRTVSFDITNLRSTRMPGNYRLVYTDDPHGDDWTRMRETVGGGFTETFESDTVYVADVRAYPYERTVERVERLEADHPEYVESELIGRSHEGREMYAMRITDPAVDDAAKRDVVCIARQHPGEVAGSWRLDAAVDYVLDVFESRYEFARDYVFHVIPHANPDGIYHGLHRHDPRGNDQNRQWKSVVPREVENMKSYMRRALSDVEWGLDLHTGTGASYRAVFFQYPIATPADEERVRRMAAASLSYPGEIGYSDSTGRGMSFLREEFGAVMTVHESYQYREYTLEELRTEGVAPLEILTTVVDPLQARVVTVGRGDHRRVLTDDGRVVVVPTERD